MTAKPSNPVLVLLASHWLSLAGAALVTTSVISWMLVAAFPSGKASENPYVGILLFLVIPAVFFFGLILMPVGVLLAKKQIRQNISAVPMERGKAVRRLAIFLSVTTLANLLLAGQFTYKAVEHMETVAFCGQSCHVMAPQFRTNTVSRHSSVACVECHVARGAAGWIDAKLAGTRQLVEVATNSYPRPIPSALESDRLMPAVETCERCHRREFSPVPRIKVLTRFADDEGNSPSHTVMMMRVGGGSGIHRAHMDPDLEIAYTATDAGRQTIPKVNWRNRRTGETREYVGAGAGKPATNAGTFTMQCVDCHNRAGHQFDNPDVALDQALAAGEISPALPGIKKRGLELLKAGYASQDAAANAIKQAIASAYPGRPDAEAAAAGLVAIYSRQVFPELRLGWGNYPNHLGHTSSPGCFRCHDGEHKAAGGKVIGQDCAACHEILAADEKDPEILNRDFHFGSPGPRQYTPTPHSRAGFDQNPLSEGGPVPADGFFRPS
ncbi:MAG: cytochrome C, partial [Acidobacteria bacterium]|nr:cytochrome C [Acidobacteriota bacterium]